jgi:glycosyltransferase involved in cell wall biosynthesis
MISTFIIGWLKLKTFKNPETKEDNEIFLSVITAARNEEATLGLLLSDLENQSLDPKHFETILINDSSVDRTEEVMLSFLNKSRQIRILKTNFEQNGKKAALLEGIKNAQGEYIVTIDADCRVGEKWLETVRDFCFRFRPQMIIGAVTMTDRGFFSALQTLEFQSLAASGAGAAAVGRSILCNAANLIFKKKTFNSVPDAFNLKYVSGDDMFLMHSIKKINRKSIFYLKSKNAIVTTKTEKSAALFFKQRLRWTSKSSGYKDSDTIIAAFLVLIVNLIQVILFTTSLFDYNYFEMLLIFSLIKFVPDFLMMILSADFFGTGRKLIYFPILMLIYPFYIVLTGFIGLFYKKD